MLKYIISILLCCAGLSASAQSADTLTSNDSAAVRAAKEIKVTDTIPPLHQIRIGFDISRPITSLVNKDFINYEAEADYLLRNELYAVAEVGAGAGKVHYDYLNYTTTNFFIRAGIDKSIFARSFITDWDMVFVGLRYGLGVIHRQEASYTYIDPIFGNTSGTTPAKNFLAHWGEVTAGVRVELFPRLSAGWDVRVKFLLNSGSFKQLPPAYIAGYGKGDRGTAFDFNFYLTYAIRWQGKAKAPPTKVPTTAATPLTPSIPEPTTPKQ